MEKPRVLIYRDFLLNSSETFIKSQGEALQTFVPFYAGLALVKDGIALPPERTFTVQGRTFVRRADNALFERLGISPRLLGLILRERPRLVHAHFGVDGARVARLAQVCRLPLVVTLHDYDVTTSDADLLKLHPSFVHYIERRPRLARTASAFLAVSRFLRERAIERGFPAEKILVHYIGIDVQRFAPTPGGAREPIVLFVGRLVPKKGCTYLIEAMAAVQAQRPDVELVMIGEGPLRAELERQAASTLKRYRFLGARSHAEVREWHSRAQLFALPSVTAETGETEGLPIAILEALAIGLPVVATRHSGIPEAVTHEQHGLLADERDAGELSRNILALLGNPELAGRLASAARTRVCQDFDLNRQNGKLESIYQQLVRDPQRLPVV